jgi:catechol 2,3-dioxygenase-like lactoylglutathione lyase family enzyme
MAVLDLDVAIEKYSAWLGMHDWTRAVFATDGEYKGVRQRVGGNVATAALGHFRVELVQPTLGRWTPVDVLETRGEGLYHLGFRVPDVAAAAQRASEAGYPVALYGVHHDVPIFAYLELEALHGVCIELIGPRMPEGMVTETRVVH